MKYSDSFLCNTGGFMTKLKGNTKISARGKNDRAYPTEPVTSVKSSKNVTTGLSPKTFRCTKTDRARLIELTNVLQSMTEKRITESKVLRGLIALDVDKNDLLNIIKENT